MRQPWSSELWYGQSASARLARAAMAPASWLYAAGWTVYASMYRWGLKKARMPHRPVICVGNLVVGGSGKTPLTMHLADVLRSMGREVVISCSGYGSPASVDAALAPQGPLAATTWGDEPAMIRWLRPDLPLIVGRDRVAAARVCARKHPLAVLLLDDGFQHLPLYKHLAILLDSAPPNRSCLPAGPYRQPRSGLRHADLVIPGPFTVSSSLQIQDGEGAAWEMKGEVAVLTAIARPDRLLKSLMDLGLTVAETRVLRDHDPLTAGTLFDGMRPSLPIVTTPKDWVKLRLRPDLGRRVVAIARQELAVVPSESFRDWLGTQLDEIDPQED